MDEKVVVEYTWKEIAGVVYQILNYQLFELDGHGISLGKLISGIFLLVLGYMISRRGAREVDNRVLTRMDVDEHLRYTLRRFIFYFFLCISTLFTLHTLNVPVTIFTVIGGALAVGIGFGSQNLVNNFISGLLVMLERPIRVGDLVEVDGVTGVIENIGIRSTTVRTPINAMMIIPNTVFIEKNMTNWTMSDQLMCKVSIGVNYNSNTSQVIQILLSAVAENPKILTTPEPAVNFVDFGDSALMFDLCFWISASTFSGRKALESQVRLKINELFRQHQIEVPFPHREVLLRNMPPTLQNH